MQRAWPSCAFLMEPLAEPEAPSRWWQEQRVGLAFPPGWRLCPGGRRVPPAWPGTPRGSPFGGHPTTCSFRWTSCRCPAHPDLSPRPSLAAQARGVLLLKQKAPPSPVLSQPVPAPIGNGGRLSPEPMYGVFLLLINPFIKGMWFVSNEGKMPRKQPTWGQLSGPWGRRTWLLSSRDLDGV